MAVGTGTDSERLESALLGDRLRKRERRVRVEMSVVGLQVRHRASIAGLLALALAGCGGSNAGFGTQDGGLSMRLRWEQPAETHGQRAHVPRSGFGAPLPAAVQAARIIYRPENGVACCVAFDPRHPAFANRRSLSLRHLPLGPGTVSVAGYADTVVPADGAGAVCDAAPSEAVRPCVSDARETASYRSSPQSLELFPGSNDAGQIDVPAVPFLVPRTLQPPPGASATIPVRVQFTLADAASPIEMVDLTFTQGGQTVAGDLAAPPQPCADTDIQAPPCSDGRRLQVSGQLLAFVGADLMSLPDQADIKVPKFQLRAYCKDSHMPSSATALQDAPNLVQA